MSQQKSSTRTIFDKITPAPSTSSLSNGCGTVGKLQHSLTGHTYVTDDEQTDRYNNPQEPEVSFLLRKDSAYAASLAPEQKSESAERKVAFQARSGEKEQPEGPEQPDKPSMSAWSDWGSSSDEVSDVEKKNTVWGTPFLKRPRLKRHKQAGKEKKDLSPEEPLKHKVPKAALNHKADRTNRKISFSLGMLRRMSSSVQMRRMNEAFQG
ncbi:hypothetical protein QFC24_003490 [Naganishia onofrii]|uniref:Uncharacterized protein n=1 Tax=Naganishia onofrii TaxID=1851511 RepID=A0ACC2XL08_9TREE|nr:hypothetical protein QFC24_003490 [Naganishia onofrii]